MGILDPKVDYSEFSDFKREFSDFKRDFLGKLSLIETTTSTRFSQLEAEIKHKVTDSEQQARDAANSAIELEGVARGASSRVEEILKTLEEIRSAVSADQEAVSQKKASVLEDIEDFYSSLDSVSSAYKDFVIQKADVDKAVSDLYSNVDKIKQLISEADSLSDQIEDIGILSSRAAEGQKNIAALAEGAIKRKAQIDDLHREILGYEIKSEDGQVQEVEGLKDELDGAYEEIKAKVEAIDDHVDKMVASVLDEYESSLSKKLESFSALYDSSQKRVDAVDAELKALLPGGMAAGLSAAYEQKRNHEQELQDKHSKNFSLAIFFLVAISLIPFAVDAYLLLWEGKDIVSLIKDTPNLIISILPLYLPVLWFAFSANKKVNLSKRLIEEYTHKEVLGKTFSGLANQIVSLPHEGAVKEDLRTRLLFNMLQVSSENPGKLITDYNKSDHPLMEALENSAKLSSSVEALAKLPGFAAMAERLSRKSQDVLTDQARKVEDGLSAQDALEGGDATDSKKSDSREA